MAKEKSTTQAGIGFCGLLVIVLITLKLLKLTDISWWWVWAPFWIPLGIFVAGFIIWLILKIIFK